MQHLYILPVESVPTHDALTFSVYLQVRDHAFYHFPVVMFLIDLT